MLSKVFRPIIDPFTAAAGRSLARAHLSPNMLTSIGIVAVVGCGWLIAIDRPVLAGVLLIPAVIIDVLDGALARATGQVTAWGGFYDSVADRIADGALLGAVAWAARDAEPRLMAAALVALVLSFCVPYARAKAEALGYETYAGPGERAERAVILIVGLILGFVEAAMWTIAAFSAITFVGRCGSVWRQATRG